MRIFEILFWGNEPTEADRSDPLLNLSQAPSGDLFTALASAYTKDRLIRRFWNEKGSELGPLRPVPPDAEAKTIASSAAEPTTASWPAEPTAEPGVGQTSALPFSTRSRVIRRPT
jgi:hypothetical protein